MIDKLTIKNFESHKRTTLEFEDGINVIVGQSDTGKSSVLRALYWLFFNKPSGDSYRSSWGGTTSVTATVGEHEITRLKSDKENLYIINGEEISSFGQGVPEVLTSILSIQDINIQKQMDSPFLLSMKPGDRAKFLNKIVDLSRIDEYVKEINSRVRETKSSIVFYEKEKDQFKGQLKTFQGLGDIEDSIGELKINYEKKNKIVNKSIQLANIFEDVECLLEDIDVYEDIDKLDDVLTALYKNVTEKNRLYEEQQQMKYLAVQLSDYSKQFKYLSDVIAQTKSIKPIEESIEKVKVLRQEEADLSILKKKLIALQQEKRSAAKELKESQENYDEIFSKLRFCPVCKSRIRKGHNHE